ncbi:uncharacterized protein BT62DRAFT_1070640 [Guyanagaster necrorhizus]|uniref:Uncharacterized protein n=1 Tax=Guyanagaster necrorhizus TaxID=856835 RepID=A0A9P7W7V5_9AGAR|nr:uncharacterized protein BT62DRAFT_1070640 [Guyanagaster necrorhizus MCA 3950]KAG7452936.1 hypothetical protein BT62DRAFT_1070640 [Guyanagaster necrorhizus MCA 3950]
MVAIHAVGLPSEVIFSTTPSFTRGSPYHYPMEPLVRFRSPTCLPSLLFSRPTRRTILLSTTAIAARIIFPVTCRLDLHGPPSVPCTSNFWFDIKEGNTLVNHAHDAHYIRNYRTAAFHRSVRRTGVLTYAYIDFDISVIFPLDVPQSECCLPCWKSWDGTNYWAVHDTAQGEPDYDPFAFDVALLGFQLCRSF